jgi:hypothetical protein
MSRNRQTPQTPEQVEEPLEVTLFTAEQIEALNSIVGEALIAYVPALESHIDQAIARLGAPASEQPEEPSPEPTEEQTNMTADNPLAGRVATLEKTLADKEAAELERAFDDSLRTAMGTYNPLHPGEAMTLFRNAHRNSFTSSDAGWLTQDGKTLAEQVKAYFDTPFGQHLLPPKTSAGSGAEKPQAVTPQTPKDLGRDLAQVML